MNNTDIQYASPGLLRMFAAMIYDSLLLAAISIAYGAGVVSLRVLFVGAPAAGQRIHWSFASSIAITIGWFVVITFFYIYFWRKLGQTLGMKTWRIQMVDDKTYQLATYKQCVVRSLSAIASFALLGVGYWCKLFHPQQKTLHDVVSGTRLIVLKKS